MPLGGIRILSLSRQAAADLRLRPRGRWVRLYVVALAKSQVHKLFLNSLFRLFDVHV